MYVKYFFVLALLIILSSKASAEFVLDCGHPTSTKGWAPSQTKEKYKVEFKNSNVTLLIAKPDGSDKKVPFRPYYDLREFVEFFSNDIEYGHISILRNQNGYFININDFGQPSYWHAECK